MATIVYINIHENPQREQPKHVDIRFPNGVLFAMSVDDFKKMGIGPGSYDLVQHDDKPSIRVPLELVNRLLNVGTRSEIEPILDDDPFEVLANELEKQGMTETYRKMFVLGKESK